MDSDFHGEHEPLIETALALFAELRSCPRRIRSLGTTHYFHHTQLAERVVFFEKYLAGAYQLAEGNLYAPAFATLRGALEHHVFDCLLFLATRYEQTFIRVLRETWVRWEAQINNREDGTHDIIDASYKSGTVRVLREGVRFGDAKDGHTLSIYYGQYTRHDPFVGTKLEQAELSGNFMPIDVHERFAEENEAVRRGRLGWEHLRRNMLLNGLASEKELTQLQVHYRFLGAYVHPTSERAEDALYGHNIDFFGYDHYASELVLLYVIALAVRELSILARFLERPPLAEIPGWDTIDQLLETARAQVSYFWFPWIGRPHTFDRIEEANHRGVRIDEATSTNTFVPREQRMPESIPEADIPYYRNPLHRLVKMHAHSNELTGFPFISPWPRDDAFRRSML